jgi:hypothetical protein
MTDNFKSGDVITYPYLWRREAIKGETEGRKNRPVVVVLRLPMKDKIYLYLLPITSKHPLTEQEAVEIPALELKRIGLSTIDRSWVILNEFNRDIIGDSYYLEPHKKPLGRFSSKFEAVIIKAVANHLRQSRSLVVRYP